MKMLVFSWFRCFVGSPPFGASSWPLAGLLLASSWPLAGFLLASCWLLPGLLLAPWLLASFKLPHKDFFRNRFFKGLQKLAKSLHEKPCFSMVSVFRGILPIWDLFLASCWSLAGLLLASCWPLAGFPARASRQSTPPEQPARAPPPEHPARAPRQSIPPEHPARAPRFAKSLSSLCAKKNVRALALRASGGNPDVCLGVRNKSPP